MTAAQEKAAVVQNKAMRKRAWNITLDLARMTPWLVVGAALALIVFDKSIGLQDSNPGLQAMLYGLSKVSVYAYFGYRLAVAVLIKFKDIVGKIDCEMFAKITLPQSIVLGASILGRAILVAGVVYASR